MPAIATARTFISHNRLESRPRSVEFTRSLRAEVRDATWLLARQWQLGEFRAEDRGAPAFAAIHLRMAKTPSLLTTGNTPEAYTAESVPLDTRVEAQFVLPDVGTRLQMGFLARKLLTKSAPNALEIVFAQPTYALAAPEDSTEGYSLSYGLAQTMSEALLVLQALGTAAVDGYKMYLAAQDGTLATDLSEADETLVTTATGIAASLVQAIERVHYVPPGAQGWSVTDMSPQVTLVAEPFDTGRDAITLASGLLEGQRLPWYGLDQASAAIAATLGTPSTTAELVEERFIPTGIQFPGSPATRWWEFEDRRIDFGKVAGHSADMGRMLLQEFMFLYQSDWFLLPVDMELGRVATVTQLQVTDVFGQVYTIQAAGASPLTEPGDSSTLIEEDWGSWSLFAHSAPGSPTVSTPYLYLPPTTVQPMLGKAVEQVWFKREEATNLVWAVEQTVPNGFGQGMDGTRAARGLVDYLSAKASTSTAAVEEASYAYRLLSSVPENWIPFVPQTAADDTPILAQGVLPRQVEGLVLAEDDLFIAPRTSLLQMGGLTTLYQVQPYRIPPTGIRIDTAYRRARWLNGQTFVWLGRQRLPGQDEGSSGLTFDSLTRLPKTEV